MYLYIYIYIYIYIYKLCFCGCVYLSCEFMTLNFLKLTCCVMHQQFNISTIVLSAHTLFMCYVFI